MHYRQLVTAGSPQSPSRAIPPSTRPHLLVCAEMQDLPEVLYQLAVNILPVVTGDPDPPVDAPIGWELTDGVIVVAYQALQRALSDCSVPVRRQQRVMSWLICFATGVTSHVDGAIAESAGPRLLKQASKVVGVIEELKEELSLGPRSQVVQRQLDEVRAKPYPAEGQTALPWAQQCVAAAPAEVQTATDEPPPTAAPPLAITSVPAASAVPAAPRLQVEPEPPSRRPPYELPTVPASMGRQLGQDGLHVLEQHLLSQRPVQRFRESDADLLCRELPNVLGRFAQQVRRQERERVRQERLRLYNERGTQTKQQQSDVGTSTSPPRLPPSEPELPSPEPEVEPEAEPYYRGLPVSLCECMGPDACDAIDHWQELYNSDVSGCRAPVHEREQMLAYVLDHALADARDAEAHNSVTAQEQANAIATQAQRLEELSEDIDSIREAWDQEEGERAKEAEDLRAELERTKRMLESALGCNR